MKRFLILLLFAWPALAQTVTNPSFAQNALAIGAYNTGAIPGWTIGTGIAGLWTPPATEYPGNPGVTVAFSNGAAITQDLGSLAAGNYSFTVQVGARADGIGKSATYTLSLGTCSEVGTIAAIPAGTLLTVTQTCTLPDGDAAISLGCSGSQCDFTGVSVVSISPPPQYQTLTFGAQLVNCTVCDGTDPQPLASASIYQGLSFALQQQGTTVQNICNATLNANAIATCNGPVNVQPAVVTFLITVFSAAGTPMFDTFAFAAPSLIIGGAPTGNVKIVIGFDATTSVPRAGFVFTQ